ncbi:phage holin family protein [Nocardioides terrisoli]|uniref:phage holin family protein n=1 Tax=Nocardioides terrisoli TaxID=3388267 RepID=UPI00287B6701|nr:phage holin family protein [Nocardioides marmorisolisilvae]
MKLLLWLTANALALLVAIWLFEGITLTADTRADRIIQLVLTGAIFGAINSLVKPVLKFLSFPFIILTLGLFLVVINALLLLLTSRIAHTLDLGFHVDGFWVAVWGSIVISLAGMVIEAVLPDRD